MARDIEADAVINDKSAAGLAKFEGNIRKSNDKIKKDYDKFGKGTGDAILGAIGKVAPKLAGKLAEGIGDASKIGMPVLIGGIVAALPVLSGLIGAAVTGGAAGAGIIGGVALATRDSRVKEAGTQLGNNLLSGLTAKAGVFVQPVLQSIDLIEKKFAESGDAIEQIFAVTSKQVVPLVDAIGNATQSVIEGVAEAASNSGPVMQALNRGIEGSGEAVKSLLTDLSSNGEANALILDRAFSSLNGTITALGPTLNAITSTFAAVDKVLPLDGIFGLKRRFDELNEEGTAVGQWVDPAADGVIRVGASAEAAAKDAELYAKALEDNAKAAQAADQAQQGLFGAVTSAGAALDAAKKSAEENGRTLSANTEKGRENRDSLDRLASSFKAVRAQQEATGASASVLNGTIGRQRKAFYDVALSMTKSKSEARRLTDQLLGIPSPKPKVTLNAAGAAQTAKNVRQEIASIRGKTVTVTVNVNASRLAAVENRLARLQNAGYGAAGLSFAQFAPGQTSRTGGATTVNATLENRISIDGAPFRSYTKRVVATEGKRAAFRNRVGTRTERR